jgi:glutamine synthetase
MDSISVTNKSYDAVFGPSLNEREKSNRIQDIEFLQVRYTNVLGRFLAKYAMIDNDDLQKLILEGIGLDGSSVEGFASIDDSDLLLVPDKYTLRLFPFSKRLTGSVISDVFLGYQRGRLCEDPRYVSQIMEERLAEHDLTCQVGAEVECFIFDKIIFHNQESSEGRALEELDVISEEKLGNGNYPIRTKSGYDAPPFQDSLLDFRFEVASILKDYYNINVTNLNHEVASSGQIEINFLHSSLTKTADNVQTYKDVVRNVAKKSNRIANFMPKPIFECSPNSEKIGSNLREDGNDNGSGMHVSVSLWTKSSLGADPEDYCNIFYDRNDEYSNLSQDGRYFVGGILDHSQSLAALVAPTVNSYQRIVPGYEAPVYIAWARGNRSTVVRIPINDKDNYKTKRLEFRAPDPSSNPYLVLPAIVAAGLDGIQKKTDPGSPIDENIYKMSEARRNSLGIQSLPRTLRDSLDSLKSDLSYLQICFSNELIETYLTIKQSETKKISEKSKSQQFLYYFDI